MLACNREQSGAAGRRAFPLPAAVLVLLVVTALRSSPAHAVAGDSTADYVFGQVNYTSNASGVSATMLGAASGVPSFDSAGRLYIVDLVNNRVVRHNNPLVDTTADAVYGQPNLTSDASATTATGLTTPRKVAFDSASRMYVADGGNHRVLRYDNPLADTAATAVYGQPTFTEGTSATTQTGLFTPIAVMVDTVGRLYISDYSNHRVLRHDNPLVDTVPDAVYGQPDFTTGTSATSATGLNNPYGLAMDAGGRLYIAAASSNRVVRHDNPLADTVADAVFGQLNFTASAAATSVTGLTNPTFITIDSAGRLYIADGSTNNRVLRHDNPLVDIVADFVLGQPNFTSSASGLTSTAFTNPEGIDVDSFGRLYVQDGSNARVLGFDVTLVIPSIDTSLPNVWYVNDTSTVGDLFAAVVGSQGNSGLTIAAPKRFLNDVEPFLTVGDTVYVDAGTYNENDTFRIDTNTIWIIGKDSASTIIDFNNTGIDAMRAIYATGRTNLTFRDFTVRRGYHGVWWNNVDTSTMTRVRCDTHAQSGILLNNGSTGNSLTANTSSGNTNIGIHLTISSNNNTLTSNTSLGNSGEGIRLDFSSNNTLTSNISRNNGSSGFYLSDDGSGAGADANVFYQNTSDSNAGWAFWIRDGGTPVSKNDTFHKNIIRTSPYSSWIDSAVQNSTQNRFSFTRNFWMRGGSATTDTILIKGMIKGVGADSIIFTPFRLGIVDTAIGADTVAPRAPDTVAAVALTESSIRVSWSASTGSEDAEAAAGLDSYTVYRSPTSDTSLWISVATVDETSRSLDNTGLTPGTSYFYRVTATDNKAVFPNQSFYSDSIATATTLSTPYISPAIPNQTRTEDTSAWTIALTSFGNDSAAGDTLILFWSVTGGGTVVTASMNDSRTLRIAPIADRSGTESVTLRLSDNQETVTQSLGITLTAVNDSPFILSAIPNQTRTEDTAAWTIALTASGNDTDAGDTLILFWSVTGGGTVVTASMNDSRTLRIAPIADRNGTETVTLRLSDNQETVTQSLGITLSAVNDSPFILPTIPNQTRTEDTAAWTIALTASGNDSDAGDTLILFWSVTGGGTVVTASMNDSRTLRIAPIADRNGTETVTLRLSDNQETVTQSLGITLTAVNDSPYISPAIPNQTRTEDTSAWTIALTSFGNDSTAGDTLILFWSVTGGGTVVTASMNDSRTLRIAPIANRSGTETVTLRLSDNQETVTQSLGITLTAANDSPFILPAISNQTRSEDTAAWTIALTASGNDTDAGDTLILFWSVTGGGTVVTATMNDSRTLRIAPIADQNGTETVTLRLSDNRETATQSLGITLTAVNDTPRGGTLTIADTEIRPLDSVLLAITGSTDTDIATNGDTITYVWSVVSGLGGAFTDTTLSSTYFRPLASSDGANIIRVTVTDSAGASDSKSTTLIVDSYPPSSYGPTSPEAIHETNVTTITFTWSAATDTSSGVDSYRLQIDTSGAFTSLVVDSATGLALAGTRTLAVNDTYYWRILAGDKVGNRAVSTSRIVRIDTVPPTAVTLSSPVANTDTTATTITFSWSASTDSVGVSGYRLQIDTANTFTSLVVDSATGLSITGTRTLTANDTYYWRVLATDSASNSSASASRQFRIDTRAPTGSVLAISDTAIRTPTIKWTAASDSIVGVALYRLRTLSLLDSSTSLSSETTSLSARIDSTLIFGNYLAELLCTDALGNVNLSVAARTFSIIPETPTLTAPANHSCTGVRTIMIAVVKNAGTDTLLIYRNGVVSDTVSSTQTTITSSFHLDTTTGRDSTFLNFRAQVMRNGVVIQSILSDTFTLCFDTSVASSPTGATCSGPAAFTLSPATTAAVPAQILVKDIYGNKLSGITVTYTVVTKPTGATGEAIVSTVTDANGISTVNLLAGDKAGVYVVKAVAPELAPLYIGFHTLEYDQPASLWRLIALNREPTSGSVSSAFSGLNPTDIFRWNPDIVEHSLNLRYEIPTSLVTGAGYYLWSATATRFSVSGATFATDTRDITIKAGWNMVGVPYAYLTRWNSAQIVSSGGSVMTLAAAEAAGIIQNKIFWYKDDAYQFGPSSTNADPILAPWTGFWLKSTATATLRLSPHFYFTETSAQLASAQAKGGTSDWTVKLTVRGDGGSSITNLFGVSPASTNGSDFALDVENPPVVSGQFAGGLGTGGAFAQELKAPFTTAQRWDFSVRPTSLDNVVTLTFADLGNLPEGFIAMLVDLENGSQTMLTTMPTYQFTASGLSSRPRTFRIYAGTEAAVRALALPALAPGQTFVTPNPGPGADGNVTFKYNVTAGGTLKLRVFDVGGHKVIDRTIDLNMSPTEYLWNCRNDRGQAISTGVYIYVLDYSSPSEKCRITEKLAIFR